MEIIFGILKLLKNNSVYKGIKCEFEYDSYGGIKEGVFPNLYSYNILPLQFGGNYFYFKNDDIVMYLYINRIRDDNAYFQTIRFKKAVQDGESHNLEFFVTETELMCGQKINIDNEKLSLTHYPGLSVIEFENSLNMDSKRMDKFRNIVENVLLYIQLLQLEYCKVLGYRCGNRLYLVYRVREFKPFIYRETDDFKKEDAELFIGKFINSPYKDYLTKTIYRLVSANTSSNFETRYVFLISALVAIESVYNMKKGTGIRTSAKNHIHFNTIVDDIFSDNDLIKIYFNKQKHWKPLLWVYRDKDAHFLHSVDDLSEKPDNGQEEKLEYIFNDNHKVLTKEFKKYFPIAQRIICNIIDINYDSDFIVLDKP